MLFNHKKVTVPYLNCKDKSVRTNLCQSIKILLDKITGNFGLKSLKVIKMLCHQCVKLFKGYSSLFRNKYSQSNQ